MHVLATADIASTADQVWTWLVASPMFLAGIAMSVASALARQVLKLAIGIGLVVLAVYLLKNPDQMAWLLARLGELWNWFVGILDLKSDPG